MGREARVKKLRHSKQDGSDIYASAEGLQEAIKLAIRAAASGLVLPGAGLSLDNAAQHAFDEEPVRRIVLGGKRSKP